MQRMAAVAVANRETIMKQNVLTITNKDELDGLVVRVYKEGYMTYMVSADNVGDLREFNSLGAASAFANGIARQGRKELLTRIEYAR